MSTLDRGHLRSLLQNVSLRYRNGKFRMNELLPMVHVPHITDEIEVGDKSNVYTLENTKRGELGRSNFVKFGEHTVAYKCVNDTQYTYVPDKNLKNRDVPEDLLMARTTALTEKILLAMEFRGAAAMKNTTNFGTATDIAGAWASASYDFVSVIKTAQASMPVPGNVFGVGKLDYLKMSVNTVLNGYINGGATSDKPSVIQPEIMATIMGVDKIVIFDMSYRSNPQSADGDAAWLPVWNNFAVLLYVEGVNDEEFEPSVDMSSYGFFASYDPDQQKRLTRVNTSFNEEVDGGSHYIEVEADTTPVIGIPEYGYLFQDITTT